MQHLQELFRMFYPLGAAEQSRWAALRVSGPGSEDDV